MRLGSHAITRLVGNEIQGRDKWSVCVAGRDGWVYGIPWNARRVVKFNPVDDTMITIGPDLGSGRYKWQAGVLDEKGFIYCAPYFSSHILKIDTNKSKGGIVTVLDHVEMPEIAGSGWSSGALALDGFIYFMPAYARHILKLNPKDDTVSSVGVDLGDGWYKYKGTVIDNDGFVYGIPYGSRHIIRFNPVNQAMNLVGEEAEYDFLCGNGVVGRDGNIYAAADDGQVLKIDVVNNTHYFVGNIVKSSHRHIGWCSAIVAIDGYIYWPPCDANRTLKFDIETQIASLVGDDFGYAHGKWSCGAVDSDGVIYRIPRSAAQVLAVYPLKEFEMTLRAEMEQCPEELGHLFVKNGSNGKTAYERAVAKFGMEKNMQVIECCILLMAECIDTNTNLYPFMAVASCENSALSAIYYLLCDNPTA